MYAVILVGYWLIFWQRFIRNPYLLCTSEIMTTNFPHWIWMGRKWQATDSIYYQYPAYIPFLSMWYWPSVLASKLTKYLSLDNSFRLYTYFILSHYFLASLIAYKLFGLFGAITLTYAGYCIKPQTPSFVYTMCWMPGMLIGGWFGAFSCFMAITGGYWPILVYFAPIAFIMNPWCMLGIIPALIQIIPFITYWRKSIRHGKNFDKSFGKISIWKLKDLFIPSNNIKHTNDTYYPESEMYMGIAILFLNFNLFSITAFLAILVCIGLLPPVQRIPTRALYVLTFSIASMASNVPDLLILLQAFLLFRNSSIYPSFPFSQWWDKPSNIYPNSDYTGYLESEKVNTYKGDFCLKENYGPR